MSKPKQPTGYVIYRGPSQLDGKPIVAMALTGSDNVKTGNMVQTYILADNGSLPSANVKSGADVSICGDCKHRPANGGACYVVVSQGPTVVSKQIALGKYPDAFALESITALGVNRMVRLGTYGDPAAVPAHIWQALVKHSAGRTGYTHQWRNEALPLGELSVLRDLVMASCDNPSERVAARIAGWRTFTVRLATDALAVRESVCPASEEAGKKLQCVTCGLCNGAESGRKGSIAIIVHGSKIGGKLQRYAAQRAA